MLGPAVVVTAPAAEPVSLPDARTFLRISDTGLDVELTGYIAAARAKVEGATGTFLCPQVVEAQADSWADLEHLSFGPVQAIAELRYIDTAGAEQVLDSQAYRLTGARLERGVVPAIGARWPGVAGTRGCITLRAEVGYPALPADLKIALLKIIRALEAEEEPAVDDWLVNHRIWL